MADVISGQTETRAPSLAPASPARPEGVPYDLIELLFFAYRDFVRDADAALAVYGFGRAHHRVLHFVDRNPGLRVTELLDILKITKQSLGRVLRELVDQGFVTQREGADRRQRLLYVTEKGDRLAVELAHLQGARIARAVQKNGGEAAGEAARSFLFAMIDAEEREAVARLVALGRPRGGRA